jgi:predicted transcriptional regulator
MLQHHLSGLPVIDSLGKLVGIVSESDFLRRSEISTQERRPRWLQYFFSPAHSANDFIHERGRKVEDVMTRDPIRADENTPLDQLVHLMEKNNIKRVPVLRQDKLVGIVTRANLLQAVASMAREVPDPTADDDHYPDAGSHRLASDRAAGRRTQRRRSPAWSHCQQQFAPGCDCRG